MSAEAPADYVTFVDRRLPELRARVAREVPALGLERAEVLAEVLSGLAGRWAVLRAAAMLLRRPGLVDRYLDRTVRREARRWRERQIYPVDLVVWETPATSEFRATTEVRGSPELHGIPEVRGTADTRGAAEMWGSPEPHGSPEVRGIPEVRGLTEFRGLSESGGIVETRETFTAAGTAGTGAAFDAATSGVRPVSVALRRAAVLDSTVRLESAALAEASIAWWHAFESRRRTSRVIRLTVVVLIVLIYLTERL